MNFSRTFFATLTAIWMACMIINAGIVLGHISKTAHVGGDPYKYSTVGTVVYVALGPLSTGITLGAMRQVDMKTE